MRIGFLLLVAVLAHLVVVGNPVAGQNADKDETVKRELGKLQGEWRLVHYERDGAKGNIGPAKLVIRHNFYVLHIGPAPGADRGTFMINPLSQPKSWDAYSEGVKNPLPAVYELNGNRLRLAYRQDSKRPTSVFGKRGSGEEHVLYVFERGDGKLETPDEQPKKNAPQLTVAAGKLPFRQDITLAKGDVWLVVLPNGRGVTLWADRGATKSGAYCKWEHEAYIEQGAVISASETVEHELFVDDWRLSYVNDLVSSPKLRVTVSVKKREEER
jgi:uncharacterized protein (TIGR03067 family)